MSIRPNRVKQQLAAGKVATILSGTNDPDLIDQLGPLGADGIWLEGEHGAVDYADLGNLTRACDLWGMTSVVRVMNNDYATIYRTLDRGAQGIVVPHVNTRPEAEAVVEAGKFAPLGERGMFTSRQGFGVGDYLKTANDQSLLIVLIEDIVGGAQSRRHPQGRPHRRLLRGAERPGDLDGPDRQHGPPGGPADDRRGDREDRRVRPHRRHAGQRRQRGALHAARRPLHHDELLPVDPGRRQGPDGPRGGGGARLTPAPRMKTSTTRILTTHVGSLPRPPELIQLLLESQARPGADRAALDASVHRAVADVVQRQAASGLDVINDGEQGRVDYTVYLKDRLTGFDGQSTPPLGTGDEEFPELAAILRQFASPFQHRPACTGPVAWKDWPAVEADIRTLQDRRRRAWPPKSAS